MRQGKNGRQVVAPRRHGFGHGHSFRRRQVVHLGVASYQQGEFDCRQVLEDPCMPQRCAFRARRPVATIPVPAGIAEPHWHDGNVPGVVEDGPVDGHPRPQTVTTGIVPGNAAGMDTGARGLSDDQQPRTPLGPDDGPRAAGKGPGTHLTGADFLQQGDKAVGHDRQSCQSQRPAARCAVMTDPEIARAIEHLGHDPRDLRITHMYHGSANRAVRLLVAGDDVVLRLAGSRTADLIDRSREWEHMRVASSLGVAPQVLAADPDRGLILYRFADGQSLDTMERPFATPVLQRLGRAFRQLRQATGFASVMDPWEKLETYLDEAGCTSPEAPDAFGAGWAVVDALRHVCHPADATPVASHVDPVAANIIDDGKNITFLDWEYAALCHPLWDPAYFASETGLDEEECRVLLAATGMEGETKALADWVRLALAVSLAWCLVRRQRACEEALWNREIAWRRHRLAAS